ncbi:NAD-dependent epimerase/dehydratase family protein [Bacillus cereus]
MFSSSSEVYGDGVSVPFKEMILKFQNQLMEKAKLMSEDYLKEYAASNSLKISIGSLF